MNSITFELGEPYVENWRFEICIDRIDHEKRKIDSKFITMSKSFCLFDLPKLGVRNTERIISEKNIKAKEWFVLYSKKLLQNYIKDWEQQPATRKLVCGHKYPSIKALKINH